MVTCLSPGQASAPSWYNDGSSLGPAGFVNGGMVLASGFPFSHLSPNFWVPAKATIIRIMNWLPRSRGGCSFLDSGTNNRSCDGLRGPLALWKISKTVSMGGR